MKKMLLLVMLLSLIFIFVKCDMGPVNIYHFYIWPLEVVYGQAIHISWEVENADTVEIDNGIGKVQKDGNLDVIMNKTGKITYTLTARNRDHKATAQKTVQVVKAYIFGTSGWEFGYDMIQTADQGYLIAGQQIAPPGSTNWWAYMVKADKDGNLQWAKTYNSNAVLSAVMQTSDGCYIAAGAFGEAAFLIKTDSEGNGIWSRIYAYCYEVHSVIQTSDGGFLIAGRDAFDDACIVKTDNSGNEVWRKKYGGSGSDYLYDLRQTPEEDYIIVGTSTSFGQKDRSVYVLKIDKKGQMLWSNIYGGLNMDEGRALQVTPEGDYVIAGVTESFGAERLVYLLKIDRNGNEIWAKTFEGPGWVRSLSISTDGGYIISGDAFGIYLVKADENGNKLWTKLWGSGTEQVGTVITTIDGGYALSGASYNYNQYGQSDIFLIITDIDGEQQ